MSLAELAGGLRRTTWPAPPRPAGPPRVRFSGSECVQVTASLGSCFLTKGFWSVQENPRCFETRSQKLSAREADFVNDIHRLKHPQSEYRKSPCWRGSAMEASACAAKGRRGGSVRGPGRAPRPRVGPACRARVGGTRSRSRSPFLLRWGVTGTKEKNVFLMLTVQLWKERSCVTFL